MKRLLAYLFLILGLGLVVSVNANAERGVCVIIKKGYGSGFISSSQADIFLLLYKQQINMVFSSKFTKIII